MLVPPGDLVKNQMPSLTPETDCMGLGEAIYLLYMVKYHLQFLVEFEKGFD